MTLEHSLWNMTATSDWKYYTTDYSPAIGLAGASFTLGFGEIYAYKGGYRRGCMNSYFSTQDMRFGCDGSSWTIHDFLIIIIPSLASRLIQQNSLLLSHSTSGNVWSNCPECLDNMTSVKCCAGWKFAQPNTGEFQYFRPYLGQADYQSAPRKPFHTNKTVRVV
jgi:hypothetical protein